MAEHSTIEWTDATWNPITGCSVVSPGCTNCYAMSLAGTRLKHHASRKGLTRPSKAGPVWNGEVRLNEEWLTQPLAWKRPRIIFVCAHGDLFHESVPDAWIDRVFAVMALAPQHTFQVLTKRSARMRAYLTNDETSGRLTRALAHGIEGVGRLELRACNDGLRGFQLPNVWLGVSAEDQRRADERVPDLLATPAAVRFVSAEPLIGPIDFMTINRPSPLGSISALRCEEEQRTWIDWIIVGGESGPNARPMHPAWACSIRDQCAAAGVAFHFKQWGAWGLEHPDWPRAQATVMADDGTLYRPEDLAYPDGARRGEAIRADHDRASLTNIYRVGKKAAGRLLDGRTHDAMPSTLTPGA